MHIALYLVAYRPFTLSPSFISFLHLPPSSLSFISFPLSFISFPLSFISLLHLPPSSLSLFPFPLSFLYLSEAVLEADEAIDAEVYVNKASPLINLVDDWLLQLRYRLTYARVLDANRKFIDAAIRYYELSMSTTTTHSNVRTNSCSTAQYSTPDIFLII
jgi:hypothetical protein